MSIKFEILTVTDPRPGRGSEASARAVRLSLRLIIPRNPANGPESWGVTGRHGVTHKLAGQERGLRRSRIGEGFLESFWCRYFSSSVVHMYVYSPF